METTKKKLTAGEIEFLQMSVDGLKTNPVTARYIKERKLSLIDDTYKIIDELLEQGILK